MGFKIVEYDQKTFRFDGFSVIVTEKSVTYLKLIDGVHNTIILNSAFSNKLSNVSTKISNIYFSFECWEQWHEEKMFRCIAFLFNVEL